MKNKLTDNVGLKLLSLLLAFIVWMTVVNISNPEISASIYIPLEVRNADTALEDGMTYELSASNVTVKYTVRTSDSYQVRSSDFKAYVDMNDLTEGSETLPVRVEKTSTSGAVIGHPVSVPEKIKVKLERTVRKTVDVTPELKGEVRDGYAAGKCDLNYSTIYMTGPESVVNNIGSVRIEVPVQDADDDVTGIAQLKFYDTEGKPFSPSDDRFSVNHSQISYTQYVLSGKTVPVAYRIAGIPADSYRYTGYDASLNSVIVRGNKDVLRDFNELLISGAEINIDGATESKRVDVDLSAYMPTGVSVAGDSLSVLNIYVEPVNEKTFRLSLNEMIIAGPTTGYTYEIRPETVSVTVSGLRADLDTLTADRLGTSLDVTHQITESPGRLYFNAPAGFKVTGYSEFTVVPVKVEESVQETVSESDGESADGSRKESISGTEESWNDTKEETKDPNSPDEEFSDEESPDEADEPEETFGEDEEDV